MFGDTLLVGKNSYNIDKKNRMFLPADSNREENDIVYLCYDKELKTYTIYPKTVIQQNFSKLRKMVDEAQDVEELKRCKDMLLNYAETIVKSCLVDSQGRIVLGDNFKNYSTVDMLGAGDHLVLYTNEEKKKK